MGRPSIEYAIPVVLAQPPHHPSLECRFPRPSRSPEGPFLLSTSSSVSCFTRNAIRCTSLFQQPSTTLVLGGSDGTVCNSSQCHPRTVAMRRLPGSARASDWSLARRGFSPASGCRPGLQRDRHRACPRTEWTRTSGHWLDVPRRLEPPPRALWQIVDCCESVSRCGAGAAGGRGRSVSECS